MNERFPKACRLLKRKEFEKKSNTFERLTGKWVLIEKRAPRTLFSRLGITVTKKFGKAHERNRFKRIVREAFRRLKSFLLRPLDLHIRPKGKYLLLPNSLSMQDIYSDLESLLHDCLRREFES